MAQAIQRLQIVKGRSGLGRSTLYEHVKQGLWPKPVKLSARAVGWPDDEVDALISARIAGKSDDEIRALVAKLVADRTTRA